VVFHVVVFHVVVFHVVVFHVNVVVFRRFTVPPSYELPASYQAPCSRVGIFGKLRRLWVVKVMGILKSRSVVFNFYLRRCVVNAYFSEIELPRSVRAVIAVLDSF
jgi:hypothetical protein